MAQPHPKWDERPVVLVIKDRDTILSAESILQHCRLNFAKWQVPDDVIFCQEIPTTSTGKIDKKTIRKNLENEEYTLPDLR